MGVEVVPRDDRAWPRRSLPVSVVLALATIAAGGGLAYGAAGHGALGVALAATGFVAAFGSVLALWVPAMRRWIAGHPVPVQVHLLTVGSVGAFVVLAWLDPVVSGSAFVGWLCGLVVANIWAIRTARANRQLVDQAEAAMTSAADWDAAGAAATDVQATRIAPVGRVLRDTVALERRRAVAWLVAGVVGLAACGALRAPQAVSVVVALTAGLAFLWVARRFVAAWFGLRDFTAAVTPPRRAFVVLLHDPAPRIIRPLLGVWSNAPTLRQGRLPRPERVYRCDDELDALECYKGSVVVHEAWVDIGPRRWSKPRWVAADAGIAVPHRRSLFGRWYMSNLLSGERPGHPRPLTLRLPHPRDVAVDEVITEAGSDGGSFPAALAGRTTTVAACALLAHWLF